MKMMKTPTQPRTIGSSKIRSTEICQEMIQRKTKLQTSPMILGIRLIK